jgi:hypothetical protein
MKSPHTYGLAIDLAADDVQRCPVCHLMPFQCDCAGSDDEIDDDECPDCGLGFDECDCEGEDDDDDDLDGELDDDDDAADPGDDDDFDYDDGLGDGAGFYSAVYHSVEGLGDRE